MNEWISVKDKVPNNDRDVLTFSPDMGMQMVVTSYMAYYGEDDDEWHEHWAVRDGLITFWRELPHAPSAT